MWGGASRIRVHVDQGLILRVGVWGDLGIGSPGRFAPRETSQSCDETGNQNDTDVEGVNQDSQPKRETKFSDTTE